MSLFQISKALTAANFAQMAYGEMPLLSGAFFITGRPAVEVDVLVFEDATSMTIAFRGTKDIQGWIKDADIRFRAYQPGNSEVGMVNSESLNGLQNSKFTIQNSIGIHEGFYSTVQAVFARLAALAASSIAAGKKVFVTGHSKGAAECVVFAARLLWERNIRVETIYNFGMPRVFSRAGAAAFNAGFSTGAHRGNREAEEPPEGRTLNSESSVSSVSSCKNSDPLDLWRVIDEADVVCRIPLATIDLWEWPFIEFYYSVGQTAFLDRWGNLVKNEPAFAHIPSDIACIISEASRRQLALVNDHGMDKYIARLKSLGSEG